MDPSSRNRLTDRQLDRFPGETLFERIARAVCHAVCHAGCLPRKELYEAWEVARRVRRRFRGGRIVDLGLLSGILLLLDDSSPRGARHRPRPAGERGQIAGGAGSGLAAAEGESESALRGDRCRGTDRG